MDGKLKQEADMLLYLTLENKASAAQIERLDGLLRAYPELVDYSVQYTLIASALRKSHVILSASFEEPSQEADEQFTLLKVFAEEERTAPTIEIPCEADEPQPALSSAPTANKGGQKTALYVLAASLAAVLLFFASVRLIPVREPVAVLAEAVSPRWHNGSEAVAIGDSFYNTDEPKVLKSGTIELEFTYGARVVVEGPAEFSCKSDNMVHLQYGRLYSRVPQYATGFTVNTPDARIVDMGTEFGVQANVDGTVELHVTHGRTSLITGDQKKTQLLEVAAGQARQISEQGYAIREISLKRRSFVQMIDTKTGLIWKGEKVIQLADLVGGGNGLGSGGFEVGIDPGSGQYVTLGPAYYNDHPMVSSAYRQFDAHPFIDGVFVPNGADGPQVVTSMGHRFEDCPKTNRAYFARIINGTTQEFGGGGPGLMLDGMVYGTESRPAIFIHANQGITFDIAAIRRALQGTLISRFLSVCGISQTAASDYGMADMYVLVEGQVRFVQKGIRKGQSCDVRVDLREEDRFLTLVAVTSPDKQVPEGYNQEHGDWCLFGEPVLVLE